jgi:FkbM family methyltransferase
VRLQAPAVLPNLNGAVASSRDLGSLGASAFRTVLDSRRRYVYEITFLGEGVLSMINQMCIAATRAMPANWLGLRLAMIFRKPAIKTAGKQGIDTELWGLRLRLYPADNGCEKNALFTPQMYDVVERSALAQVIAETPQDREFTFVDIGANAGLYSLFVAAQTKDRAKIIAIEPQPEMAARLTFNIKRNTLRSIQIFPVAVAEAASNVAFGINHRDRGGSALLAKRPHGEGITVAAQPLRSILDEAGVDRIDALKIDIEGAEDEALAPFLATAPSSFLPRLIIIEDSRTEWKYDLFDMFRQLGYQECGRSKHNRILRQPSLSDRA